MQRTVHINGNRKVYRGKNVNDLIRKVEADFPMISNWEYQHYVNKRGRRLYGDCINPDGTVTLVSIPNL